MKLPLFSSKQVLTALVRMGFVEVHRKGSRVKNAPFGRSKNRFSISCEVDRYTLQGALNDADIDIETFLSNIR